MITSALSQCQVVSKLVFSQVQTKQVTYLYGLLNDHAKFQHPIVFQNTDTCSPFH